MHVDPAHPGPRRQLARAASAGGAAGGRRRVARPAVWGIRFANPSDGFVFGNGLWETTDGGERWTPAASPGGSIESLEVIDGQVLAITATCTPDGGCGQTGTLMRRPLAGGGWQVVAQVSGRRRDRHPGPGGGGARRRRRDRHHQRRRSAPSATPGRAARQGSRARLAGGHRPNGLAVLCAGDGAAGSVDKTVFVSDDLGAHWTKAGSRRAAATRRGSRRGRRRSWWWPRPAGRACSTTRLTAGRSGAPPTTRATAAWASTTSASPPRRRRGRLRAGPVRQQRREPSRLAAAHQQRRGELAAGSRSSARRLPLARPGVRDQLAGVRHELGQPRVRPMTGMKLVSPPHRGTRAGAGGRRSRRRPRCRGSSPG